MTSTETKQVMKAPSEIPSFDSLVYPFYESQKLDGWRCLIAPGLGLLSSKTKPIRNPKMTDRLEAVIHHCNVEGLILDGELFSSTLKFKEIGGALNSYSGDLYDIEFHAFDLITHAEWHGLYHRTPFEVRLKALQNLRNQFPYFRIIPQVLVCDAKTAELRFQTRLSLNQEGSILKSPHSPYKHGRCTFNEQWMFKFKEFVTVDATIVQAHIQQKLKANVPRSYRPDNLIESVHREEFYEPDTKIGSFTVRTATGQLCRDKPGVGFTDSHKTIWFECVKNNPDYFLDQQVKISYMPHGTDLKPRVGTLLSFDELIVSQPSQSIIDPV